VILSGPLPENTCRPRKALGFAAGKFNVTVIRFLKGVLFDLSGGHFRADSCTFAIPKRLTSVAYRACFFDGSYEAEERELIRSLVKPEDRVLELGAWSGTSKLQLATCNGAFVRHPVALVLHLCCTQNRRIPQQTASVALLHPAYPPAGGRNIFRPVSFRCHFSLSASQRLVPTLHFVAPSVAPFVAPKTRRKPLQTGPCSM